jgi:hypothetical protein
MSETTISAAPSGQQTAPAVKNWPHILLLLFVTIMSYGMLINKLGYIWDDWGVLFARYFYGDHGLAYYASLDRPFTKLVYSIVPRIIGYSALRWHIFAILVWWINGSLFYVFIKKLFPSNTRVAAWASLLFIVFPTFSTMYDAIIYPILFLGLMWMLLSLIFMARYISKPGEKGRFLILSLIFSLLEILQSEYWLGIELCRLLFIMVLASRRLNMPIFSRKTIVFSIKKYLPYLVVICCFVFWRMVFYKSMRPDTDQHDILNHIKQSPASEIGSRVYFLITDVLITNFFSWVQCFDKYLYTTTDPKIALVWISIILVAVAIIWVYNRRIAKADRNTPINDTDRKLAITMIIIGLITVVVGQFPFVFAHEHIRQDTVASRTGLPTIFGSTIFIAGALILLSRNRKHMALWTAILVGAAAGYQCRINVIGAKEQKYYKDLYYQMSWRIPYVQRGTAFFIDYDPEQNPMAINYALGLVVNGMYDVNPDNQNQYYWMFLDNLSPRPWTAFGKNVPLEENHFNYTNFHGNTSQTITLMQPAKGCLRVVDSSNRDLMDLSPYAAIASTISNTALIKNDTTKKINYDWLHTLFGSQKTKCWCYYFEKAELARQFGDWQKTYDLLEEGLSQKLKPENDVEWVTYIEACLHTHHYDKAREILSDRTKLVSKFSKSYVYDVLVKWKQTAPAAEAPALDEMIQFSLAKASGDSKNR